MSKDRDNKTGIAGSSIADAIRSANALPDGPADAATIIDTMVKEQEKVLLEKQADRELYGPVECSAADGSVTERFGRKSCAAIQVVVPCPALGLKFDTTVWGRLVNDPTGTTVTFEAGMPKGMRSIDEHGKDRLLAHIEVGAQSWAGYEKTTDAVIAKLTGQTAKPGTIGARPKLVKRVVLAPALTA